MKKRENQQNNKQRGKETVKLVLAVLLILLLMLCVYQCASRKGQEGQKQTSGNIATEYEDGVDAITEIDISGRQEAVDKAVEEGMMHVNYLPETVFEGRVSKSFNVKNIKNNHGPIQFAIYDENKELIYESKLIAPGYEMNAIQLTKELKRGLHHCTIKIRYAKEGALVSSFPIKIDVR